MHCLISAFLKFQKICQKALIFWELAIIIVLPKSTNLENQIFQKSRLSLVWECILLIFIVLFSILYELITEQRAWKKQKEDIAVYNLVHSNNYSFFVENSSTGNKDIDSLILDCVKCDQKERPTAEELLKRIKKINF